MNSFSFVVELYNALCSVYEKMKEKIEEVGRTLTGFKAKVSAWGKSIGLKGNRNIQKGYIIHKTVNS